MNRFKPAKPSQKEIADAELTFVGVNSSSGNTYHTYSGRDAEKAKTFLRAQPVADDRTYIVVETPDGVWGTDSSSLYLENLRPWQLDTSHADCTGSMTALIDGFHNLALAARGIVDNFLVEIACGNCAHSWIDGVRYRDFTLTRCPRCAKTNRVDSHNTNVSVGDY